eukprot:3233568-Pleurochrysis_carterae.AAC.3
MGSLQYVAAKLRVSYVDNEQGVVHRGLRCYADSGRGASAVREHLILKEYEACYELCYTSDNCNAKWHLVAIFDALGRITPSSSYSLLWSLYIAQNVPKIAAIAAILHYKGHIV